MKALRSLRSRGFLVLVLGGALIAEAGCGGRSKTIDESVSGRGGGAADPGGTGGVTPGSGGVSGANVGGVAMAANGGAGGSSSGSAGAAPAGAGGVANGGAGGVGGAADGGAVGIPELIGALDGRLIQIPCADSAQTDDCNTVGYYYEDTYLPCVNGHLDMRLDHPIGGTPGAIYLVTMHFYGILEPKNYGPDVERESGSTRPENLNAGADPAPWAVGQPGLSIPVSGYNTYEVRVFDQTMNEVGVYFVNSDTEEGHYTYVINYERTIPVVGGGVVRVTSYDFNCRMIKNCGATAGAPCAPKARTIDVSAASPPPPPDFEQPNLGSGPDYPGQWWLIDVIGAAPL